MTEPHNSSSSSWILDGWITHTVVVGMGVQRQLSYDTSSRVAKASIDGSKLTTRGAVEVCFVIFPGGVLAVNVISYRLP